MPRNLVSTEKERDRAILVAIERQREQIDRDLEELESLVDTAGGERVATIIQKRQNPSPSTYLGTGKVGEVKEAAIALHADVVIFDDELTPVQQRNLTQSL